MIYTCTSDTNHLDIQKNVYIIKRIFEEKTYLTIWLSVYLLIIRLNMEG